MAVLSSLFSSECILIFFVISSLTFGLFRHIAYFSKSGNFLVRFVFNFLLHSTVVRENVLNDLSILVLCSKQMTVSKYKTIMPAFPGGAVVENLPANAGDTGSNPGLGRSHMPWSN